MVETKSGPKLAQPYQRNPLAKLFAVSDADDYFPSTGFLQRGYGDCQSLAALDAIMHTDNGREYLASLIQTDHNENYTVTFPGREPVTVTKAEIESDKKLAMSGSWGLSILEKATLKIHKKEDKVPDPFKLYLGPEKGKSYLIDLPVAKNGEKVTNYALTSTIMHQMESGNAIAQGHVFQEKKARDINGKEITFPAPHAYAVYVKDGHIEVSNPHDATKRIKLSNEEAGKVFGRLLVAAAPGRQIVIDPALKDVAKASLEASEAFNKSIETAGPFSLGPDKARGTDALNARPQNPQFAAEWNAKERELAKIAKETEGKLKRGEVKLRPFLDANSYPPNSSPVPFVDLPQNSSRLPVLPPEQPKVSKPDPKHNNKHRHPVAAIWSADDHSGFGSSEIKQAFSDLIVKNHESLTGAATTFLNNNITGEIKLASGQGDKTIAQAAKIMLEQKKALEEQVGGKATNGNIEMLTDAAKVMPQLAANQQSRVASVRTV